MANKVISIEERIPKLKEQRKKKANRRMITLLFLFFMLVITIIYFQSPLSKIGEITVTGNQLLSKNDIISSSNLTDKTVVFNLNKGEIRKRILQSPIVKNVKIDIHFPNKITIAVDEYQTLGYIYEDGSLKPFLENGMITKSSVGESLQYGPMIQNFKDRQMLTLLANQLIDIPVEIRNSISEIVYSPKKSDEYSVKTYMNDGNEVRATLKTFADKMKYYPAFIKQLDPKAKGIIDLEVGAFFKSYQTEMEETSDANNQVKSTEGTNENLDESVTNQGNTEIIEESEDEIEN